MPSISLPELKPFPGQRRCRKVLEGLLVKQTQPPGIGNSEVTRTPLLGQRFLLVVPSEPPWPRAAHLGSKEMEEESSWAREVLARSQSAVWSRQGWALVSTEDWGRWPAPGPQPPAPATGDSLTSPILAILQSQEGRVRASVSQTSNQIREGSEVSRVTLPGKVGRAHTTARLPSEAHCTTLLPHRVSRRPTPACMSVR